MTRKLFLATTLLTLLASAPATTKANDIVDFLRAVRGPSRPHRFDHRPVVVHTSAHRDHGHGHSDHDIHSVDSRHVGYPARSNARRYYDRGYEAHRSFNVPGSRARTSVSLQIGSGYQAPQQFMQPPLHIPPVPAPVHEPGCFVTCPVALEPHVLVHHPHDIAPRAVPVVVAVRNPHLGRYGSVGCVESLVYVQVFVPPCPLKKLKVSPCRTKIELDYGDYEVEITSCDGHIDVEYDD